MSEPSNHAGEANEPGLFAEPMHVSIMRRMRLLRPQDRGVALRRILLAVGVTWVPLALLCLLRAWFGQAESAWTFFTDAGAYARYLLTVPLLIVAEYIVLPRLGAVAHHFRHSHLIGDEDLDNYDALVASSRKMSAGIWPSAGLLLFVYALILLIGLTAPHGLFPPWHHNDGVLYLSLAGIWHVLVSLPIVMGLMLAWLWRLGIWMRFLARTSKMSLRLITSHPDRAAGLHFLAHTPRLFIPVAMGFGAVSAGNLADKVFLHGQSPLAHPALPIATAAVMTLILIVPPLVFTRTLLEARHRGIFAYGHLAQDMGIAFQARWINRSEPVDASALEQPDFSSTTDLYSIADNALEMNNILFDPKNAGALAVATLVPFAPIFLTVIPAKTVFDHLLGMLF